MADRTVKVTLIAQAAGFIADVDKASNKVRELGSETEKLAQRRQAFTDLGTSMLAVGTLAAVGAGLAISKYAEFDQAMSSVQAATHESAANMGLLRDAAIKAGADTVFTAKSSAQAIEELAKAGVSTADILNGGLNGALALASAGSLDVSEAAETAASAMTQFKLSGQDIPHIADLLAAGAGKAQGSVHDLGQALNQAGLVASSTGLTIDETTGALAAFASAGLIGSDAGTSFKTMLQRLTPQSQQAQQEMDRLGISAYDASGKFIGMEAFAGNLAAALAGLSDQQRNASLNIIFGQDAIRAANVLYQQGAPGIKSWIDKVNDSGYAAETARLKLDNLKGDVEKLGGSFDSVLIKSGSGANDALRGLTQTATDLVNGVGSLPGPVLAVGAGFTILVAGAGLLGGGLITLIPKIAATKAAMSELDITGVKLAKGIGKGGALLAGLTALGAGLGGANAQVDLTIDKQSELDAAFKRGDVSDFTAQLDLLSGSATELHDTLDALYTGNFLTSTRPWQGVAAGIDAVTFGATSLSKQFTDNEARFRSWGKSLVELSKTDFKGAADGFRQIVNAAGGGDENIRLALSSMPDYRAELVALLSAQGRATSEQEIFNLAMGEGDAAAQAIRDSAAKAQVEIAGVGKVSKATAQAISDMADGVRHYDDAVSGLIDANSDMYQSIDDAKELFGKGGFTATLDLATKAGRENAKALKAIAVAGNEAAAQTYETSGSQEQLVGKLTESREALFKQARQFFDSDQAAWDYVNTLMKTPEKITTEVTDNGSIALTKMGVVDLSKTILATPDKTVTITEPMSPIIMAQLQELGFKVTTLPNGTITIATPNYDDTKSKLSSLADRETKFIDLVVNGPRNQGEFSAKDAPGYASGGTVRGPGTSKSDSVLVRLSAGEEVIQEPYASRNRGLLKRINSGHVPGYAMGGTVGYQYATAGGGRSSGSPVQVVMGDRPIYTDNGAFVGMIREIAGGEARLEIAGYAASEQRDQNRGWAPVFN